MIYLCGPIRNRTDADCVAWRDEATVLLGGAVLNPMVRDYRAVADPTAEQIRDVVESDKADIDGCSGVLVHFDRPSAGTSMEILYAWERNIPVVVVNRSGEALPIWLRYHSNAVRPTLAEAVEALRSLGVV